MYELHEIRFLSQAVEAVDVTRNGKDGLPLGNYPLSFLTTAKFYPVHPSKIEGTELF
jgi:hypothetical protein